jgi:MFS family permease
MSKARQLLSPALLVAALGYFVDVYDLILFLVVKNPSLADIKVPQADFISAGTYLLNCQMVGMLVGGIAWGVLGDKIGRTKVLFGSIIIYSLANIANAFVFDMTSYATLRFIAGFGLAGELGAGVTLVSELLPKYLRGYGTTIIAAVGVFGAVVAGLTGEILPWRASYIVGGILGLLLLTIRISVKDSLVFTQTLHANVARGEMSLLIRSPRRLLRYVAYIVLGLPIWFIVGILLSNANTIASLNGVSGIPKPGWCIACCYLGLFVGDILAGLLSQYLQSRKRPLGLFIVLSLILPSIFLTRTGISVNEFYALIMLMGISGGYWILLITSATERFGTNLRATVTTTIPNFIRGAVVPMSTLFIALTQPYGVITAAQIVGVIVCGLAAVSLAVIKESFHDDLNFVEE